MAAYLDRHKAGAHDFIVRVGWNALRLRTMAGKPFDLIATLRAWRTDAAQGSEPREWTVQALCDRTKSPRLLPLRLIIQPLPPDKIEARRKALRRIASKHQDTLDPRSLLAAGFMILATSLPAEIPAAEICAAYRLRWQIEIAFKRLKSLIHIDRIPTSTECGSLSWLYPHLILALLTDDACQEFLESSP
jgi:IS4 transposase